MADNLNKSNSGSSASDRKALQKFSPDLSSQSATPVNGNTSGIAGAVQPIPKDKNSKVKNTEAGSSSSPLG